MKELTGIIELLGEENEKKLKDGIVELLLQQVERDIENKFEYDYIIDFDEMFKDIQEQVKEETKNRIAKKYKDFIDKKIEEMLKN